MKRKLFKSILSFAVCVLLTSSDFASARVMPKLNTSSLGQYKDNTSQLKQAFTTIAQLPDFQSPSQAELKNIYPAKLGTVKCVLYKNSDPRNTVLEILSKIPENLLYSEQRTDNDKIARCYIDVNKEGKAELLYIFVGWGGNDLGVALFTGASLEIYKKEAESLNE